MAADVVHRDQRHAQRRGAGLGKVDPHQHRADEAGGIGHGDGVDVLFLDPGRLDGAPGQDGDSLHMAAGGDLRHDAAVDRVQRRLGEDLIGEHLPAVLDDGDGGLVTGGFKGKYFQSEYLCQKISS